MTYEEVKQIRANPTKADMDSGKCKELSKMIDEAVDKMIPIKAKTAIFNSYFGVEESTRTCPVCFDRIIIYNKNDVMEKYCRNCGQRLEIEK